MTRLQLIGSVAHNGGVGSIVGGGGEVVPLPAGAQAGDLCVLTLCAARLSAPGDTVLDEDGNPVPADSRSWTSFLFFPDEGSDVPHCLALAGILGDDLSGIPLVYGGGGTFGFLDEGYNITIYRGVASIVGADVGEFNRTYDPDEPPRFSSPDMAHTNVRVNAAMGGVGSRIHGFVTGFPTSDLTGEWTGVALTDPGFNASRTVLWQSDASTGYRWLEYLDQPGDPFIPPGSFGLDGTLPTYAVGVLYLEVEGDKKVTRQYPRDDGYGLVGGPRLFPPTRQGRVFGGQQ